MSIVLHAYLRYRVRTLTCVREYNITNLTMTSRLVRSMVSHAITRMHLYSCRNVNMRLLFPYTRSIMIDIKYIPRVLYPGQSYRVSCTGADIMHAVKTQKVLPPLDSLKIYRVNGFSAPEQFFKNVHTVLIDDDVLMRMQDPYMWMERTFEGVKVLYIHCAVYKDLVWAREQD